MTCLQALLGCSLLVACSEDTTASESPDAAPAPPASTEDAAPVAVSDGVVHQTAPYNVTFTSAWDGTTAFDTIRSYGNFGVGALEGFTAELVFDREHYAVESDGVPRIVSDDELATYAIATHFAPNESHALDAPASCDDLQNTVLPALLDANAMYAIRISGHFLQAQPRSFEGWSPPYPSSVVLLTSGQITFDLLNVDGAIVAYYLPQAAGGFCSLGSSCSQVGFHFHFLTDDRSAGGHLLNCQLASGTIELQRLTELRLHMADGAIETFTPD